MRLLAIVGAVLAMLVSLLVLYVVGWMVGSMKGLQEALDHVDKLQDEAKFDDSDYLEKQQYIAGWIDACRFIIDFKRGKKWSE